MILKTEFKNSIPQYTCNSCYKCESKIGQSLCSLKHRGCCFYFPKFNLVDIQRMSRSERGLQTLQMILNTNGTKVKPYYIESNGLFEKDKYEQYKLENLTICDDDNTEVHDETLLFKACPFVVDGKGCTIDSDFRNPVCNFYLCDEIKKSIDNSYTLKKYEENSRSYWHFYDWENTSLMHSLMEQKVNLISNFDKCIAILQETELSYYDFPQLDEVNTEDSLILT